MIRSYWFKNYKSFKEKVEVNLTNTANTDSAFMYKSAFGDNVSLATCLIGPNAGGKTTALKPLSLLSWLIDESFKTEVDTAIPCKTHIFSDSACTQFCYEFSDEQFCSEKKEPSIYRYLIEICNGFIVKETLSLKTTARFSYLLDREWNFEKEEFLIKSRIPNFSESPAFKNRNNVSLLALLRQNGYKDYYFLNGLIKSFNLGYTDTFDDFLSIIYSFPALALRKTAAALFENENLLQKVNSIVSNLDMGVDTVIAYEQDFIENKKDNKAIQVKHCDGEKTDYLPFHSESAGTQSLIVFLANILPILEKGGIIVVDELEANLHPHVMEYVLKLFAHSKWNPKKAQIIFTSHAINIINTLQKEQIFMVEKIDCYSELWRLDQIQKVRRDDNYAAKYLAGAYGALPNI